MWALHLFHIHVSLETGRHAYVCRSRQFSYHAHECVLVRTQITSDTIPLGKWNGQECIPTISTK